MKELTDQDLKGILRAITSVSSPDILLGFARAAIAADRATLRAEVEALPRFSNSPEELYGLISNLAVLALIDKMGGKV